VADQLTAVKWRNWKMHIIWQVNMYDPPVRLLVPKVVNLLADLKEERDVGAKASWVGVPMTKIIVEFEQSLRKYPPIKTGTPDPYVPPK
jgi:arylsulfatase